jgi:hypothetical protein
VVELCELYQYRSRPVLLAFRGAEPTHDPDDKAYQQNQAKAAASDHGATKIKPAAAEQEKENYHEQ